MIKKNTRVWISVLIFEIGFLIGLMISEIKAESRMKVETETEVETIAEVETEIEVETTAEVEIEIEVEIETEAETTTEVETETEVDQEELELLAHLIYAEAGGNSKKVQEYVATVVMNRVASTKFPNTVYEVIFQKNQYECTWNGGIEKTPSETSYEVAAWALNGGRSLDSDYVWQANFQQGSTGFWIEGLYFGRL